MKCWKVRRISDNEYHVIENRFVGEPEYVLARCTHPSPAGQIAAAMRLAQVMDNCCSRIHNSLQSTKDSLDRWKLDLADAIAGRYDEDKEYM